LRRKEWELDGTEKYEKGILEHVKNHLESAKSKNPVISQYVKDNPMGELAGAEFLETIEEDAKEEEGVIR